MALYWCPPQRAEEIAAHADHHRSRLLCTGSAVSLAVTLHKKRVLHRQHLAHRFLSGHRQLCRRLADDHHLPAARRLLWCKRPAPHHQAIPKRIEKAGRDAIVGNAGLFIFRPDCDRPHIVSWFAQENRADQARADSSPGRVRRSRWRPAESRDSSLAVALTTARRREIDPLGHEARAIGANPQGACRSSCRKPRAA